MQEKVNVPVNCFMQGCYNETFERAIKRAKDLCFEYNKLNPNDYASQREILAELIGKMGREVRITPPFWCDYGCNIEVGDYFYSNHNLVVNDGGKITFGDNVFIAPNCVFTTAEHAIDPTMRRQGVEIAKPITVGNDVWIGAGAIVLAGAEIGDNTVIGAGSVVKGKIPANVVAVGAPCRVLRPITEDDKHTYPIYNGKY